MKRDVGNENNKQANTDSYMVFKVFYFVKNMQVINGLFNEEKFSNINMYLMYKSTSNIDR